MTYCKTVFNGSNLTANLSKHLNQQHAPFILFRIKEVKISIQNQHNQPPEKVAVRRTVIDTVHKNFSPAELVEKFYNNITSRLGLVNCNSSQRSPKTPLNLSVPPNPRSPLDQGESSKRTVTEDLPIIDIEPVIKIVTPRSPLNQGAESIVDNEQPLIETCDLEIDRAPLEPSVIQIIPPRSPLNQGAESIVDVEQPLIKECDYEIDKAPSPINLHEEQSKSNAKASVPKDGNLKIQSSLKCPVCHSMNVANNIMQECEANLDRLEGECSKLHGDTICCCKKNKNTIKCPIESPDNVLSHKKRRTLQDIKGHERT